MRLILKFVIIGILTKAAWAQEKPAQSLADLRANTRYGERVQVTDFNGAIVKGAIVRLSSTSLSVKAGDKTWEWQEAQIREIKKRRNDPWWNGAVTGIVVGALGGAVAGGSTCAHDSEYCSLSVAVGFFSGMGVGAAAGSLIDFSIRKMDTAFQHSVSARRPIRLTPILTKDGKGMSVCVSF